jgi:RNA polymerase sigma factor (sigma-70 family)
VGVQLELLFDGSSVAGMSDGQLLERFTARHDPGAEVAFEALFARHAPMVLGICRRILGDSHHAEDTFQAVFFILACKARSIQNPDLVATWLYGVALRTAKREKSRLDRRRKNEEGNAVNGRRAVMMTQSIVPPPEAWAMACEQTEILHDEIARLPGTFRLPVILCYFAGLTLDEAARRLRWPPGTVRSRLARARDKLRRGLTRRGVVLSGAALAVTLTGMSASAGVSTTLRAATTSAAIRFATFRTAGGTGSTAAASIAHGVLRSMLLSRQASGSAGSSSTPAPKSQRLTSRSSPNGRFMAACSISMAGPSRAFRSPSATSGSALRIRNRHLFCVSTPPAQSIWRRGPNRQPAMRRVVLRCTASVEVAAPACSPTTPGSPLRSSPSRPRARSKPRESASSRPNSSFLVTRYRRRSLSPSSPLGFFRGASPMPLRGGRSRTR